MLGVTGDSARTLYLPIKKGKLSGMETIFKKDPDMARKYKQIPLILTFLEHSS